MPVLGGVIIVALSISSKNTLNKAESRLLRGRKSRRWFCVKLVKLFPVHRNSVDIFSYSGPSGILGSHGKRNTA